MAIQRLGPNLVRRAHESSADSIASIFSVAPDYARCQLLQKSKKSAMPPSLKTPRLAQTTSPVSGDKP
jgi:hypothetical protein